MHRASAPLPTVGMVGVLVAAGAVWTGGAEAQPADQEEVRLGLKLHDQITLPSGGIASFNVSGEAIFAEVDDRRTTDIVVVARAIGEATLLINYEDGRRLVYRIFVTSVQVPARENIQLDFYFVQLAESYNHQIGIGWPTSFGGSAGGSTADFSLGIDFNDEPIRVTSASAVLAAQALPRIDMLQSTGWAKVMRHASVVTENGTQATFRGGEEINIVAAAGLTAQVQSINAGADVTVTPRYDRVNGRVHLVISAEMSDLTPSATGEAPGRTYSHIDATVNMRIDQALILGGLVSDSASSTQTGLPFLSQIPVLGVLFGANGRRRNYSQTALFIIPSIVHLPTEPGVDQIEQAFETYWNYTGDLDEVHLRSDPARPSPLYREER